MGFVPFPSLFFKSSGLSHQTSKRFLKMWALSATKKTFISLGLGTAPSKDFSRFGCERLHDKRFCIIIVIISNYLFAQVWAPIAKLVDVVVKTWPWPAKLLEVFVG